MTGRKLHADEIDISEALVRRLLAAQFPAWATLRVEPVVSDGTDNAMFRLGRDMAVRLPRYPAAAKQVEKEQTWLPRLAPHLPLPIPVAIANGSPAPANGYPWQWSVCRWLDGEQPISTQSDVAQIAVDLAEFVAALHKIDPADGPPPGAHNTGRGEPLARRDLATRDAIAALHGTIDVDAVTAAWEADLNAPVRHRQPVWIHGDLSAGNLLVANGRLSGVIDFGCLGVGDPACDLIVAWNLFSEDARRTYRAALMVDDATWARGRGWALSVALIQLPYYRDTNPVIAANAVRTIETVLADHRGC